MTEQTTTQAMLSVSEACAHIAKIAGQRAKPSTNALWRWMRRGVVARNGERVALRHVRIGGRIFTRGDWIESYLGELAEADAEHFRTGPSRPRQPRQLPRTQRNEHDQARARLAAQGLI